MSPHAREVLVGVDGGATEAKAHEVVVVAAGREPVLALGAAGASSRYAAVDGFVPVALEAQLEEARAGAPSIGALEREAGELWVGALAACVAAIAAQRPRVPVRLGLCLPGLKTVDGRGTLVVRNGPRVPDLVDRVQARLVRAGVELASPVAPLLGDGEACGLGERLHERGLFRGIRDAYYVGGGTGVAECLLVGGEVTPLERLEVAKAWQLASSRGASFDDAVSVSGLNRAWAAEVGAPLPLAQELYPEQLAARGDARAAALLRELAEALAELAALRVERVPEITGRALERVVVGQRLGRMLADPDLARCLREPAEAAIGRRVRGAPRGLLAASTLREAPAVGAAARALPGAHEAARAGTARG